jgi:transcriptional regulator with XRE-family HTH domain
MNLQVDYRRQTVTRVVRLSQAVAELTREKIGAQKDVAAKIGVSVAYVSALFSGRKSLTAAQLNRLLDACNADPEQREAFNAWGAREAGWRF